MLRTYIQKLIEDASPGEDYTNKMFVFDVDETLFETKAQILVIDKATGEVKERLSNQDFNGYKLGEGETFSFDQFKDMDYFRKTSTPIKRMLDLLRVLKEEGQVVLMTARVLPSGRNALSGFYDAFADYYGTRKVMQDVLVTMVGGSENKKAKFESLIQRFKPDYIEFYDDHPKNLEDLKELEREGLKIRTFILKHGREKEYHV